MTVFDGRHRKFWDGLEVTISGLLIIGALSVHTPLSTFLLLLLAAAVSAIPFYHREYPDRELPIILKIFQWLVVLILIIFILWCLFWLLVVIAFSHSNWQF